MNNIIYGSFAILVIASLTAVRAQQDCLETCRNTKTTCDSACSRMMAIYAPACRSYCTGTQRTCQGNCPATTATAASFREIGRGTCGSQSYVSGVVACAIVNATQGMTLQVSVIRQISNTRCISGQNFFVAADNSFMWVYGGCAAEFSIVSVEAPNATTAFTTTLTTASTTTTPIPTTTSTPASRSSNSNICGQAGGNGFRIIGGTEADNCEFPWMVMVFNQRNQGICGGTIISRTHILSAAHCFFSKDSRTGAVRKARPNELIVFSGSSTMPFSVADVDGLLRRSVSEITTHENYNHTSLVNDIAVVKLTAPIIFDACHKPLCMVDGSKTPQQATNCRTMGWGLASNNANAQVQTQLQYVDLPVAADTACRRIYGALSSDKTFCAGATGKDACQGDSGGPFTCKEANGRYHLFGIVSAGINANCGNALGIYTKVSTFLQWINSKTT